MDGQRPVPDLGRDAAQNPVDARPPLNLEDERTRDVDEPQAASAPGNDQLHNLDFTETDVEDGHPFKDYPVERTWTWSLYLCFYKLTTTSGRVLIPMRLGNFSYFQNDMEIFTTLELDLGEVFCKGLPPPSKFKVRILDASPDPVAGLAIYNEFQKKGRPCKDWTLAMEVMKRDHVDPTTQSYKSIPTCYMVVDDEHIDLGAPPKTLPSACAYATMTRRMAEQRKKDQPIPVAIKHAFLKNSINYFLDTTQTALFDKMFYYKLWQEASEWEGHWEAKFKEISDEHDQGDYLINQINTADRRIKEAQRNETQALAAKERAVAKIDAATELAKASQKMAEKIQRQKEEILERQEANGETEKERRLNAQVAALDTLLAAERDEVKRLRFELTKKDVTIGTLRMENAELEDKLQAINLKGAGNNAN